MKYFLLLSSMFILSACNVTTPEGNLAINPTDDGVNVIPNETLPDETESSPDEEEAEAEIEPDDPDPIVSTKVIQPLGTVTVNSGNYACNGGRTCYDLTISCPDVAQDIGVVLYVSAPASGVPYKGTITFHSGATGTGFWASETNSTGALNEILAAGFRGVQVKWKTGWTTGDATAQEGIKRLACRPATVLKWVHDNLYTSPSGDEAFCATGNSGGSVQVSISMIHYGAHEFIDLALPTSGPGVGRIDIGCSDPASPLYFIGQTNIFDNTYGVSPGACTSNAASFAQKFIEDSLALGDTGTFYYPKTMVWNLVGADDTTTATVAQSEEVFNRWDEVNTPYLHREIIAGAGHSLPQSVSGADRVSDLLLAQCKKYDPVEE